MTTWRSFWDGWGRAAALWPVLGLLYVVDTAVAAALAGPFVSHLAGVFGYSTMAPQLADSIDLSWLIEAGFAWKPGGLRWLLYPLVPLVAWLTATLLRGGVLGALAGGDRLSWTGFIRDCGRFFWRLLFLPLLFVPLAILLGLMFVVLYALLGSAMDSEQLALARNASRVALLVFLGYLLQTALDYARIGLVLEPARSVVRHALRATWFLIRWFPQVVVLALAFRAVALLMVAVYPVLLGVSPLLNAVALALLVQQLSMLALSWQRLAMLGAQMELYVKKTGRQG